VKNDFLDDVKIFRNRSGLNDSCHYW